MTGWREAASKKSRRWKGAGASSKKPAQKTRRKWAQRILAANRGERIRLMNYFWMLA
jgi:hypothetical protein